MNTVALEKFAVSAGGSVDPSKYPAEEFDLYSIPAYDKYEPEVAQGSEIGSTKKTVQPGDVLLSRIVPHIRRVWVVGPSHGRRQIGSGEWIIFRGDSFDSNYLRHMLMADPFHKQFMQTVAGVGGSLLRARPSEVEKIKIPLPPLPEQKRIAAILDKADAIRRKRQQAVKLTEELLRSVFLDMFGDPVTNPKGWEKVTLGDIAIQVTDGEHQTPIRTADGIKLLSARNIRNGNIDVSNVDYVSIAEHERIKRRCNPVRGDILISCSGTIGRVTTVETDEPFSLVRSVALVKLKVTNITSKYLEHYLRTPALQRIMQNNANSSSQANLFQNQIRDLPICLPKLSFFRLGFCTTFLSF